MTTPRWLLVVAVVGAAGIAVGRFTARTPDVTQQERATETIAEATTQEAAAEVEATTTTQEAQAARVEASRDRMRIVAKKKETRPDGSTSETSLEVDAESARLAMELQASREETSRLHAALAEARAAVRVEVREVERRVEVHTPLPDWRVGALVGWDGGLAYGAEVQWRLAGPVYLTGAALTSGVGMAGVGFEFP